MKEGIPKRIRDRRMQRITEIKKECERKGRVGRMRETEKTREYKRQTRE